MRPYDWSDPYLDSQFRFSILFSTLSATAAALMPRQNFINGKNLLTSHARATFFVLRFDAVYIRHTFEVPARR